MKMYLASLIVASALTAAEPNTNSMALTLEEALTLAERHHPALAEGHALVAAADGRARQAGLFPNPEAIARIESAPIRGRTSGDAEYLAGVAQSVPLGPRLSKARAAERLDRERQAQELEVRRREVRNRVHAAFAAALYQEKAFVTQSNITETFAAAAQITGKRVDAGDALQQDLAKVELELVRAKVELDRVQSMRLVALRSLAAAIGDMTLTPRPLDGKLDTVFEVPALEEISAAMAEHPALLHAATDVRATEARVALAKAQRIPDITVEVLYRRLQAERRDAFDVGVSIPVPLFDRNQGRVREARGQLAAAEARVQSTRNDLELRSHEAHAHLTTALARTRSLRDEVLPRADTILQTAEKRYAAGDARLTDLLPIRRDWAGLQLTYLESLRDVAQAWAEMRSLMPNRQ